MKIAIGICARNEEFSIISMLDSLLLAISRDSDENEFRVFMCANGCSDQTIPLIQGWQTKNKHIHSDLLIIDEANLIESQRVIVNKVKELGIESVIFLDADIIVDKDCISELVSNSVDKEIKAAYAISIPLQRNKCSVIEKSLDLYDKSTRIFSERKHLHGRVFLIKTEVWDIPKTNPRLIADDIYLSFYLLRTFGPGSIKKVSTAKVYFNQISTYSDFYNASRRRNIEIGKCFMLFPEFKSLPPDQVNRSFLWKNLFHESFGNIFIWLFLLSIRKIAKFQFKIESFFGLEENNQWVVTKTSKIIDVYKKPILVLIEGLDCSGKKTTARILQGKFIDNGVSCTINIGPLNSKIYRLVSRLVSLHKFPNFIRSIVYAFDGIGDNRWYKNFTSEVVIQISSPMRNWSYALVNKKYLRIFIMHLIKSSIPKYDSIWYLTAPYNIRLERHLSQAKHKENPDEISARFPGKKIFDKMESELKRLLNTHNKISDEFDTDKSSYNEIINHIFSDLNSTYKIR